MENKQTVSVSKEGKLIIKTDNGTVTNGATSTDMIGDFTISHIDVAKLLHIIERVNVKLDMVEASPAVWGSWRRDSCRILCDEEVAKGLKLSTEDAIEARLESERLVKRVKSVESYGLRLESEQEKLKDVVEKHHPRFYKKTHSSTFK